MYEQLSLCRALRHRFEPRPSIDTFIQSCIHTGSVHSPIVCLSFAQAIGHGDEQNKEKRLAILKRKIVF